MRYGNPSIAQRDRPAARRPDCERILVVPLYPQYAAQHHGDGVRRGSPRTSRSCAACRRCASSTTFHDDPGYIKALAQSINDYWMKHGRPDRLVHVVPRRAAPHARPGRPLPLPVPQDRAPARGGAGARAASSASLTFQSRFGKARVAQALHRGDARRAGQARACAASTSSAPASSPTAWRRWRKSAWKAAAFLAAGGNEYHAIPCLNEHPAWIAALTDIVLGELPGWLAPPPDAAAREQTLLRAKALGATR